MRKKKNQLRAVFRMKEKWEARRQVRGHGVESSGGMTAGREQKACLSTCPNRWQDSQLNLDWKHILLVTQVTNVYCCFDSLGSDFLSRRPTSPVRWFSEVGMQFPLFLFERFC
jgi:hypothetical protein